MDPLKTWFPATPEGDLVGAAKGRSMLVRCDPITTTLSVIRHFLVELPAVMRLDLRLWNTDAVVQEINPLVES